jgi:2-dehydropantoate 2-reductase
MKFAILGSGGVGGYFGGRFTQAGVDVTFIARGRHLEAMKQNGLRVDSINGDFVLPKVQAADSLADIKNIDVIFLAIKAWQLDSAVEQIKSASGDALILPMLNGMEHMDILRAEFGERVLGGFCRISSFLTAPGQISHVAINPFIAFNEWKQESSPRIKTLREVFARAQGINVDVPNDIELGMWEKYLLICAFSGVGAVTRQPVGVFRSIPESRKLFQNMLNEVVAVASARGVALTEKSAQAVMERIDNTQPDMMASMQKDMIEGRPSELDAQLGALIRMARKLNVPVPTTEFIYASLLPMEKKARGEI